LDDWWLVDDFPSLPNVKENFKKEDDAQYSDFEILGLVLCIGAYAILRFLILTNKLI
jgi:hypothetical protein